MTNEKPETELNARNGLTAAAFWMPRVPEDFLRRIAKTCDVEGKWVTYTVTFKADADGALSVGELELRSLPKETDHSVAGADDGGK